ncbi:MAG TPA: VWA domain-containing protein, partial [Planctomycetota bacterium]|nr:VWA domain-containing protein [Planctomycetota bacterium]
ESFVAAAMFPRILPPDSASRFWCKTLFMELGLIFSLVALAGPRFGAYYEEVRPRGADLYVLIDVSRSMLAQDVPPNRLARAKSDVSSLLNRMKGERVGLIAFAGKAVVKCPLSTDYDFYRRALDEIDTNSAPRGGTAIGDAIRKALEVFPAEADRERSILLITDGDDQQSYPLEAADAAAEKRVTIYAVGLGDAEQGSRVPNPKAGPGSFIEHEGQQVWSKLDNSLLEKIALKTNGVYVPASTRAYDLGELYESHLKGRRGEAKEQRRVRLAERYQIFLALALLCLLAELLIRPYPPTMTEFTDPVKRERGAYARRTPVAVALLLLLLVPASVQAAQPRAATREGLELFSKGQFDEAQKKFASAAEKLQKDDPQLAAIVAFDLACTYHRKGDTEKAREEYLKAGLAHDKELASEAHYNLGLLSAETARALAGETPELVEPDKRKEIIDKLLEAVASFRQSIERKGDNPKSRKNIELVRQWIKFYTDRWREIDREKIRKESNLAQFIEYLVKMQNALRENVKEIKPTAPRDTYFEYKRAQDELAEEIPPLKEKIQADVEKPQQPPAQAQTAPSPQGQPQMDPKQFEEAMKMLLGWADEAGKKMESASSKLQGRMPQPASDEQKAAVTELERIWEAVVPFHPLLNRDYEDQKKITRKLNPNAPEPETEKTDAVKDDKTAAAPPKADPKPPEKPAEPVVLSEEELKELTDAQEQTLRRTALLKPKAEAELKRMEAMPQQPAPQAPPPDPNDPNASKQPQQVDPEKVKEGYRKAIELAPKAVEKMTSAVLKLREKKADAAYPDAEEARRILEEIVKAQPPNPNQDKNKDQKNQDSNQNEQKKDEEKKKDQEKKDQDKDDKEKQDQKKDEKAQKPEEKKSADAIEDVLRKVREREKQKRDRDKELKARIMGQMPVDKDW